MNALRYEESPLILEDTPSPLTLLEPQASPVPRVVEETDAAEEPGGEELHWMDAGNVMVWSMAGALLVINGLLAIV